MEDVKEGRVKTAATLKQRKHSHYSHKRVRDEKNNAVEDNLKD